MSFSSCSPHLKTGIQLDAADRSTRTDHDDLTYTIARPSGHLTGLAAITHTHHLVCCALSHQPHVSGYSPVQSSLSISAVFPADRSIPAITVLLLFHSASTRASGAEIPVYRPGCITRQLLHTGNGHASILRGSIPLSTQWG
ncbi:hypothetical protein MN608_06230 [Microdochium nivale]|nr:hypothetical protein MN608_06230 [Microdochium nivale]